MNLVDIVIGLLGLFVGYVCRDFFPSYFRKKGENLATKQDIAEITESQKAVEHKFNDLLEISKQRHSLRTLVADKRLEVHQQAFLKVKQLLAAREDEAPILSCRTWMDEHCLYLTAEARKAVWEAIGYAEARSEHIQEARKADGDPEAVRRSSEAGVVAWNGILGALAPIATGVELPALGREELIAMSRDITE